MSPPKNDIDPRVLGQLLAAQSVFSLLSSRLKMGEFVCRAVEGVPGVASCAVCLPGAERPRLGGEPVPECADCGVPGGDIAHDTNHPCRFPGRAGIQTFPLKTLDRYFGFLLLKLGEREQYAPYEPFVSNLANGLAVNIDRQWQKEGLEAANVELRRHREQLGELVRERTAGLEAANEELRISEEELASQLEELQQSRDALRESEALLPAAIDILPVGLWIIDAEGKIVTSSAAAQRIWAGVRYLGIDQLGEYKGWRTDSGKLIEAHEWAGARALEKGETTIEQEVEIECFDGTHKIILDSAVPLRKSDGSIGGAVTINQDITERKRADEALRESESKYKDLFENAQVGMYRSKIDGSAFLDVNQKFAEIIGFSREELLGTPGRIRWADPENRDRMMKLLKEKGGFLADFETQVLTKNGSVKTVLASTKLHPVEGFIEGIMVDITNRKRAEKALKESEIKFQNTVKYLDEGYYSCALDGLLLEHNQAFNQILGFDTAQNLKGEKLPDFWQNPDDRKEYLNELMAKGFIRNYLINAKTISGRKIVVKTNSHLVRDENNQLVRIDGTFTDFTEPKRLQDELERSNKELEQFAYVASHDLQEPLRMISSFTQLLARRYKDKLDAEANEFIDYAVDGANRMQRRINDLLTYSRVGSRGKPFAATDFNDILGQVLVNLTPAIEETRAIITNDEMPTVSTDESQMVQLFQNLIGNAIKFRAMEVPLIHISVKENDREWTFGVKDNGIGIDLQYRERIFGVFQRLHSKEEYPGTGIGLAICKKIVEHHGGRIWFESASEKGSIFYFTLPKQYG